jgi:hypothetical protein
MLNNRIRNEFEKMSSEITAVSQRRDTARTSPQNGNDSQPVPAACKDGRRIRMISVYEFLIGPNGRNPASDDLL